MKITYWSDYACPYCYIGETRLYKALEQAGIKDAQVEMKSFELNPSASNTVETDTLHRFAVKYGLTLEQAQARIDGISLLGKREGIDFKYATTRYTNTLDAHRLTKFAVQKLGTQAIKQVSHLLFDAYFTKNLELAQREVLLDIARQLGLAEDEVSALLASKQFTQEVRQDEQEAAQKDIFGVPFFVFNDKYIISGAQTTEGIAQLLRKIHAESQPQFEQGMACGINGCGCK